MSNAAEKLAMEFTALAQIGNVAGQNIVDLRWKDLEMESMTDYLSWLADQASKLSSMLDRLHRGGVSTAGMEDLAASCYKVVFAYGTGWCQHQSHTGAQRVSQNTIDKLHMLSTLFVVRYPGVAVDTARITKISNEVASLREFIEGSGIRPAQAAIFFQRLDSITEMLREDPVDLMLVSEQLSSLLGLMTMLASSFDSDAEKKKWQDRVKTAAATLAGELFVSLSSEAVIAATEGALSILP